MDLKEYFSDLNKTVAQLEKEFPPEKTDGAVFVTSLKNREKNSTPGQTLSANYRNAARVITDGTHRLATSDEISAFLARQEDNRIRAFKSEQGKKEKYIVIREGDSRGIDVDVDNMSDVHPQFAGAARTQAAIEKANQIPADGKK